MRASVGHDNPYWTMDMTALLNIGHPRVRHWTGPPLLDNGHDSPVGHWTGPPLLDIGQDNHMLDIGQYTPCMTMDSTPPAG